MNIYAIYITDEVTDWNALLEPMGKHRYVASPHMAFVASEDVLVTKDISDRIKLEEDGRTGIVMKIGANYGYFNKGLWEWMEQYE